MSIGNLIAKGVGAASLYFVAKDAHTWAKIKADERVVSKNAEAAAYYMENSMMLDRPSVTLGNIKNKIFNMELSENIRGHINSVIGYFGGLFSSLVSNVIPFTLGMTALFTKGKLSKASAIGLAIVGGYTVIKEGFGLGTKKDLTRPTE